MHRPLASDRKVVVTHVMIAIPKPRTNRPPTSCLMTLAVETMTIPATMNNPPVNIPTLRPQISEMGPANRAYQTMDRTSGSVKTDKIRESPLARSRLTPTMDPTVYMEKIRASSLPVPLMPKWSIYWLMGEIPEKREPSYPLAHDPRKVTNLRVSEGIEEPVSYRSQIHIATTSNSHAKVQHERRLGPRVQGSGRDGSSERGIPDLDDLGLGQSFGVERLSRVEGVESDLGRRRVLILVDLVLLVHGWTVESSVVFVRHCGCGGFDLAPCRRV